MYAIPLLVSLTIFTVVHSLMGSSHLCTVTALSGDQPEEVFTHLTVLPTLQSLYCTTESGVLYKVDLHIYFAENTKNIDMAALEMMKGKKMEREKVIARSHSVVEVDEEAEDREILGYSSSVRAEWFENLENHWDKRKSVLQAICSKPKESVPSSPCSWQDVIDQHKQTIDGQQPVTVCSKMSPKSATCVRRVVIQSLLSPVKEGIRTLPLMIASLEDAVLLFVSNVLGTPLERQRDVSILQKVSILSFKDISDQEIDLTVTK